MQLERDALTNDTVVLVRRQACRTVPQAPRHRRRETRKKDTVGTREHQGGGFSLNKAVCVAPTHGLHPLEEPGGGWVKTAASHATSLFITSHREHNVGAGRPDVRNKRS